MYKQHIALFKQNKKKHSIIKLNNGCYYVTADGLNERLYPSPNAKSTNVIDYGQAVDVMESKKGWARISRYYDGYVEGVNGTVAIWVSAKYLSKIKHITKTAGMKLDTPLKNALVNSDDYNIYHKVFIKASKQLIAQRKCKLNDLIWIRSQNYKPKPVYFVQCRGINKNIYLNVKTEKMFQ